MRTRGALVIAAALVCAGSAPAQGRFVRAELGIPSAGVAAPPEDGYLAVGISTDLAPFQAHKSAFKSGWFGPRFSMVAVTIELRTGIPEVPTLEFPVELFDLENNRESSLTALELGRAQFIALAPGSGQPSIRFIVRAIPRNIAREFQSALTAFDAILGAAGGLLGPQALTQATTATKVLAGMLAPFAAESSEWIAMQQIGLRDPSGAAVVPLNGSPVVVFLRPANWKGTVPTFATSRRCGTGANRVCLDASSSPYSELPTLAVTFSVLAYRSLETPGRPLACTWDAAELSRVYRTVAESHLTRQQANAEPKLLDAFALVLAIREGRAATDSGASRIAYEWSRRYLGIDTTAYWGRHYSARARTVDDCFQDALTRRGPAEAARVAQHLSALRAASAVAGMEASSASTSELESRLATIAASEELLAGAADETSAALAFGRGQVEAELVRRDRALVSRIASAQSSEQLEVIERELRARQSSTNCRTCAIELGRLRSETQVRTLTIRPGRPDATTLMQRDRDEGLNAASALMDARAILTAPPTFELTDEQRSRLTMLSSQLGSLLARPDAPIADLQRVRQDIQAALNGIKAGRQRP